MSKNKTAAGTLSGGLTAVNYTKLGRMALGVAVNLAAGLLLARAAVFGGYAPFGVAAVAAAGAGSEGLSLLCGAALGYLLPGGAQYPVKYVTAAAMVFVLKWLLSGRKNHSTAFDPCAAGITLAACSGALWVGNGFGAKEAVYCAAEALLCGCAVLFFKTALPLLHRPSRIWGLNQKQMVSVIISLCILLLAFEGAAVGGISLGRVLGILAVLLAARYGREAGGGVAGVSVGMLLSLGDRDMAGAMAGYGFGGLLAGVFAPLGRFGCAVAFVLASTVSGLYLGNVTAVVTGLYESMIATVVFLLLPERLAVRVSALFSPAAQELAPSRLREEFSARLTAAAGVLSEISETMAELTGRLTRVNTEDISTVFTDASDIACKRCGMRHYCWQTAANDTIDAFNNMTAVLGQKHELNREDVPDHFAARCCRLGELVGAVNKCYAEFITRRSGDNRALMLRRVLSGQYAAFGQLLRDEASAMRHTARRNVAGAERVRAALADCGMEAAGDSFCQLDGEGHMLVEARIAAAGRTRVGRSELREKLSEACGRPLSEPAVVAEGDVLRVTLMEQPTFTAKFGQAVIPREGEQLCGDSCESFLDGNGHAVLLVSDGMGCGGPAAVESGLASHLMSRMLHAGFDYDTAMSLANTAMIMKSGEESFATFDIASVDLYTGETEFFKAGAPASYVRRNGRVERITESSMPAGILQGVKLERSKTRLSRGDLIVLVSDGVITDDDTWLVSEIARFEGDNLRAFTAQLAKKARALHKDGHVDDITVLVGALR